MATVQLDSDTLDMLNNLYKEKEAVAETEDLFCNLGVSAGFNNDGPRKLEVRQYTSNEDGSRSINSVVIPDELRRRLLLCTREYYDELNSKFKSITISGDCIPAKVEELKY